ncbi:hypothetical protein BJX62DRAFT_243769 [Aspergillus germanicus]
MLIRRALQFLLLQTNLVVNGHTINSPTFDEFKSPPATSRPKFRYWLPDASIPIESLQRDIADLESIGAGGFELVPFYSYGNPTGAAPPTDWNVYGFGTKAFRGVFEAALEAAVQNDVLMDFSLGASQGQGTPAEPGTQGLAVHLQLGVATVRSGMLVTGQVPEPQNLTGTLLTGGGFMHGLTDPEKGELKGVIAGQVISESANEISDSPTAVKIDEVSIIDLKPFLKNGHLTWRVPPGNDTWKIFAFWEGFTNQLSCSGGVNGTTTIQQGSLVVDHFSEAGAKVHTSFLDQHVLTEKMTKKNLKENGQYAWEDSMELLFVLPWTRGFLERFEGTHGYSLGKYLPLLFNKGNSWANSYSPYNEEYVYGDFDTDGVSIHNANYRWTLGECYREYLDYHVRWARPRGIEFSTQVSYNLPLSFLNEIPSVDGPEGESLGFDDNMDAYRSLAGPAQLSGKTDISSEVGAVFQPAFSQTVPELLLLITKSYAGGLTMMVIHGMAYSGPYVGTGWPGYQPFSFRTTESWSRVQPAWHHMDDVLRYLGRTQHILKTGKPRIDIAMYHSSSRWGPGRIYESDNLQKQGMPSHTLRCVVQRAKSLFRLYVQFPGSGNLDLREASVSKGLLALSGPGYKALVFPNNTQIDDFLFSKLREFDRAGLPIFFVGQVQNLPISAQPNETYNATEMVGKLSSSGKNIYHVSSNNDLPAALAKAQITPRVQFTGQTSSIFSVYRTEPESKTDYVWLLNDANTTASFIAEFELSRDVRPFFLNAWTGDAQAIAQYSLVKNRVHIPLKLHPHETTIIAFKPVTGKRPAYVTKASGQVEAVRYTSAGKLYASLKGPSTVTVKGAKEHTHTLRATVPPPLSITRWDLVIQDWRGRPNDTNTIDPETSVHEFRKQPLIPWKDISPELESVSGIGAYSSTFTVPDVKDIGAYLSVGPILNTLRVWINGDSVGPFGADNAKVDISDRLRRNKVNSIKIEVSTTLYNRLKADVNSTLAMGYPLSMRYPEFASAENQDYGLQGPVVIDWVVNRIIA